MASSGKRKTTMAKLNRERRLIERRLEKQAKKHARKQAAADHPGGADTTLTGEDPESAAEVTDSPDSSSGPERSPGPAPPA